jgi:hypothetical protein
MPSRPKSLTEDVRGRFLALWSKARECAGYDRREWSAMQEKLDDLISRVHFLEPNDPTQPGITPRKPGG